MPVHNLLYPEGENDVVTKIWSTEEIFDSVKVQDDDDNNTNTDEEKEFQTVRPSKKEVTGFLSKTLSYLDGEDNPEANELSNLLEKYHQKMLDEIHFNGVQTSITQYFNPMN
jgi:hypothetical protein